MNECGWRSLAALVILTPITSPARVRVALVVMLGEIVWLGLCSCASEVFGEDV